MKLEFIIPNSNITPKQLASKIPELVREYLEQASQENKSQQDRHGHNEEGDLLRLMQKDSFDPNIYIEATKDTIGEESDLELTKKIDWESELPVTPEKLAEICEILFWTVDKIIALNPETDYRQLAKEQGGGSPFDACVRQLCNDTSLNTQHGFAIIMFGHFLKKKYLIEIKEKEDIQKDKSRENYERFGTLAQTAIMIIYSINHEVSSKGINQALLKQVSNTLLTILKSQEIELGASDNFSDFVNRLEVIIKDTAKADLDNKNEQSATLQAFIEQIKKLILEKCPNQLANEQDEPLIAVAETKNPEKPFLLLRPDDLYFTYPKEQTSPGDSLNLPVASQILDQLKDEDKKIGHNVSLFDSKGKKVFWGDLSENDIPVLDGPYYVLNERDSHLQVPAWAIIEDTGELAQDGARPEGAFTDLMGTDKVGLDLGYIRTRAVAFIQDGKYTKVCHKL